MAGDAPLLKPRTVTEILDAAFRLYRENFITFLGILAVTYVPMTLAIMAVTGYLYSTVPGPGEAVSEPAAGPFRAMPAQGAAELMILGVTIVLSMIAIPLATAALTQAVGRRYLNEPVAIGQSYGAVGRIFISYFVTILLKGLVCIMGTFLCVIPGIIFMIWFVFTAEVCILENVKFTDAMGRSRELVRGQAGNIILMGILLWIIQVALSLGIGVFSGFVMPRLTDNLVIQAVSNQALGQVITMLLQPFVIVAWILLYYDIRIRKEAFDLEVLARAMGTAKPAAPPA